MRVIILAAGYGSRMYPLAQDMPKCLLTIKKETLLGRQIRILGSCGISDITVVTGFHSEKIVKLFGEEVAIRYNPHYEITGNMFSLWTVRNLLTDDTLIINADVVFTEELVEALLADDNTYCLVVDNRRVLDTEDQKVKTIGDAVIEVSKTMAVEEAYGEVIGIAKIKKKGVMAFKESMFEGIKLDSNAYWLTIFQKVAERRCKVNFLLVKSPWTEIDTKEDYEEAQKEF